MTQDASAVPGRRVRFLPLSRRQFLGGVGTVAGLPSALLAQVEDFDDYDLEFTLDPAGNHLTVAILLRKITTEAGGVSEFKTDAKVWQVDRRAFGPKTEFRLRREGGAGQGSYRLDVMNGRLGDAVARTAVSFTFALSGEPGQRRYRLTARTWLWQSADTADSVSLTATGGSGLQLREFIDGAPLRVRLPRSRSSMTLYRLFRGQVAALDSIDLGLLPQGAWRLDTLPDRQAAFAGGWDGLRSRGLDLQRRFSDLPAAQDAEPNFSGLTAVAREVSLTGPLHMGRQAASRLTLVAQGKAEWAMRRDEADGAAQSALSGKFSISHVAGPARTGPFPLIDARLLGTTDGQGRVTTLLDGTAPADGPAPEPILAETLAGRMLISHPAMPVEAPPAAAPQPFRTIAEAPFRALVQGAGAGTLLWTEMRVVLTRHLALLPGSSHSQLDFAEAEILFVDAEDEPDLLPRQSFVRLKEPVRGGLRARLSLDRAVLTASRAEDLAALSFGFRRLALEFWRPAAGTAGVIALVNATQTCDIAAEVPPQGDPRPDPASTAPDDTRPVLIVEFPPQHILEQAIFAGDPTLPDVVLNAPGDADHWAVRGTRGASFWTFERIKHAPGEQPKPLEGQIVINPGDRADILRRLSGALALRDRRALRAEVSGIKSEFDETFREFAHKYASGALSKQGLGRWLPLDQRVYMGDFGLSPDARILARTILADTASNAISEALRMQFEQVRAAAATILAQDTTGAFTGHETAFPAALRLEFALERAVPAYQLFRDYYRDRRISNADGLGIPADAMAMEFVIDLPQREPPEPPLNRKWAGASHSIHQSGAAVTAFATDLAKGGAFAGTIEGRLSSRSRLAFRVACRDAVTAARARLSDLPQSADAALTVGSNRRDWSFAALTDWAGMELSVVRQASAVYRAGPSGSLGIGSDRRADLSTGGRLAALGFAEGSGLTSAQRAADLTRLLATRPALWETEIVLPARLSLSPSNEARFEVRRPIRSGPLATPALGDGVAVPLWQARLAARDGRSGLRVISSPDLRASFMQGALRRPESGTAIPSDGPPPLGNQAPWLIGREETNEIPASILDILRAVDPKVLSDDGKASLAALQKDLKAEEDDSVLCAKPAVNSPEAQGWLPRLIGYLCGRKEDRAAWSAVDPKSTTFRTSLSANDRHQLAVLGSGWGLPAMGDAVGQIGGEATRGLAEDRHDLIDLMPGHRLYIPRALDVTELALSALGGTLRHDTTFSPPVAPRDVRGRPLYDALSIERWQHWTQLGRDIHAQVTYKGYLFPLGHRASLVKVTERTFRRDERTGTIRAFLRQRLFVRLGEKDKLFPAVGQPDGGRMFPTRRVTVLTDETPDLADPFLVAPRAMTGSDPTRLPGGRLVAQGWRGLVFWPSLTPFEGGELRFDLAFDDIPTRAPLLFIDNTAANDDRTLAGVARHFNALGNANALPKENQSERTLAFGGEKLRYGPELKSGDTSFETASWTLGVAGRMASDGARSAVNAPATQKDNPVPPAGEVLRLGHDNFVASAEMLSVDQPAFYPTVALALLNLRQNERLTGALAPPVRAMFDGAYIADGLPPHEEAKSTGANVADLDAAAVAERAHEIGNGRQILLVLLDNPEQSMGSRGDQTGGLARPSGRFVALSRATGPVTSGSKLGTTFEIELSKPDPIPADDSRMFLRLPSLAMTHSRQPKTELSPFAPKDRPTPAVPMRSPKDIEAATFDVKARFLGIDMAKLIRLAVEFAEAQGLAVSRLVETVIFGAAGEAEEAAEVAMARIKDTVLRPLDGALTDLLAAWEALDSELLAAQAEAGIKQDVAVLVPPVPLAELFPALEIGLRQMKAGTAASLAEADVIGFAVLLGELAEAGRRLIDAVEDLIAQPLAGFDAAYRARIGDLDRTLRELVGLTKLLGDWAKKLKGGLKELALDWAVDFLVPPGADDDPVLRIPLPVAKFADFDLGQALAPRVKFMRQQLRLVLKKLVDGNATETDLKAAAVELKNHLTNRIVPAWDAAKPKVPDSNKLEVIRVELSLYATALSGTTDLASQLFQREIDAIEAFHADLIALLSAVRDGLITEAAGRLLALYQQLAGNIAIVPATLCGETVLLPEMLQEAVNTLVPKTLLDWLGYTPDVKAEPVAINLGTANPPSMTGLTDALAKIDEALAKSSKKVADLAAKTDSADSKIDKVLADLRKYPPNSLAGQLDKGIVKLTDEIPVLAAEFSKLRDEVGTAGAMLKGIAQAAATDLGVDADTCEALLASADQARALFARLRQTRLAAHQLQMAVDSILGRLLGLVGNSDVQKVLLVAGAGAVADGLINDIDKAAIKSFVDELPGDLAAPVADVLHQTATMLESVTDLAAASLEKLKGFLAGRLSVTTILGVFDAGEFDIRIAALKDIKAQMAAVKDASADPQDMDDLKKLADLLQRMAGTTGHSVATLMTFPAVNDIQPPVGLALLRSVESWLAGKIAAMENALDNAVGLATESAWRLADDLVTRLLQTKGTFPLRGAYAALNDKINEGIAKGGVPAALLTALRAVPPRPDYQVGGADRLAQDLILIEKLKVNPLIDTENRRFVRTFVEEWQAGRPTPKLMLDELAKLALDILRAQFVELIDLRRIRSEIEARLRDIVPAEIRMSYSFNSELPDLVKDATFGIFIPESDTRVDIEAVTGIRLNVTKVTAEPFFRAEGALGPFKIKLIGEVFDALTMSFFGAQFRKEGSGKAQFKVRYKDFTIGRELEFVQDLQSLWGGNSGFSLGLRRNGPGIVARYDLDLPIITIGTVSFSDVAVSAFAELPFDDSEPVFGAGLSSRDKPFTIAAAPFGGSGSFMLYATANGLVGFDASYSYGAAGAFEFGPMRGKGRIDLGVYIRHIKVAGQTLTEISGTFFAGGSATLGPFNMAASLYVKLGMQVGGAMHGLAIFTYSFSLGFADFEFSVQVEKTVGKGFNDSAVGGGGQRSGRLARPIRFAKAGPIGIGQEFEDPTIQIDLASPLTDWSGYRRIFDRALDRQIAAVGGFE